METSKEYYPAYHKEYAGKGFAATGVALGAAALAGVIINGGFGLGRGLGNCNDGSRGHGCCGEHGGEFGHGRRDFVDRFELLQSEKISCLEANNAKLQADIYTDNKVAALNDRLESKIDHLAGAVERRIDGVVAHTNAKFEHIEHAICNQNVMNERLTGAIECQEKQINNLRHRLDAVTKEVIPLSALCPEAMPRFNSFVTPTAEWEPEEPLPPGPPGPEDTEETT